jgi:RNA recognition motif-containing protein
VPVTLYVGNLPWTATEDELAEVFGRVGRIVDVRIIVDKVTQRSRGYGFVEMDGVAIQEAVGAMNGVEVRGRRLAVSQAQPRAPRPPRY